MKKTIAIIIAFLTVANFAIAKELYRAPSAGDKGAYYILKTQKITDDVIKILTSRVGKGSAYTDFTELKVNCKTRQYFEFAGGYEDGAKDRPTNNLKDWSKQSKWTSLVKGSSKYDLVEYICKKKRQ